MTVLGRIFHQGCERETTLGSATMGLAAGAVLGAVLTTAGWVFLALAADNPEAAPIALIVLPVAFVIWAFGLVALAAPGWWLLHRLGARCQQAAMIYGGGLTLVAGAGLLQLFAGDTLLGPRLASLVLLTLAGVVVERLVGRIAYAEPTPPSIAA